MWLKFHCSDSKLTLLLKNELGGNCKTRGILCLKPTSDQNTLSAILNFTTRLTQVKNFPIVNDSYAQVSGLVFFIVPLHIEWESSSFLLFESAHEIMVLIT